MSFIQYLFKIKKEGTNLFLIILSSIACGLFFSEILGISVALIGLLYFCIASYAASLDYEREKSEFQHYCVDNWAKEGDSPEEISRRQSLIMSQGVEEVYSNFSSEMPSFSMDNYFSNTHSESFNNIDPVYDLSNPFNASYGTGTSLNEITTGTDFSSGMD